MQTVESGGKLKHGTATKIARRLKLSIPHVTLVARGLRPGSKKLLRAIERERQKQAKAA
jgi:hypothetical protein